MLPDEPGADCGTRVTHGGGACLSAPRFDPVAESGDVWRECPVARLSTWGHRSVRRLLATACSRAMTGTFLGAIPCWSSFWSCWRLPRSAVLCRSKVQAKLCLGVGRRTRDRAIHHGRVHVQACRRVFSLCAPGSVSFKVRSIRRLARALQVWTLLIVLGGLTLRAVPYIPDALGSFSRGFCRWY